MKYRFKLIIIVCCAVVTLSACGRGSQVVSVEVESGTSTNVVPLARATSTSPRLVATSTPPVVASSTGAVATSSVRQSVTIPASVNLPIPFASQAPLLNWDAAHEEACEEASMILAQFYYAHEKITPEIMEEQLQKVLLWEQKNGYSQDLTAAETVGVLRDYFGMQAKVRASSTVEQIKYELSLGNVVLVPAAGRMLKNPNYTGQGPIYHMLVVRGYDSKNFITNDVGTRKGNGYLYAYDRLMDSIHDWNHTAAEGGMTDEEMAQGAKNIIIVSGPKK